MAASSSIPQLTEASSSTCTSTYHVFLSFGGQDTRHNFTDHLYAALVQAGYHTFRDDNEIRRGENIDLEIQRAIHESKISIVVLSKHYASSRWCLDELLMIMKRREIGGHIVLPVFYHVDPSHVFEQEAFDCLEEEKDDKVEAWRAALREVAQLGGMVLQDGYESLFIQNIVKEVGNKLSPTALYVAPKLFGKDSQVERINLWLQNATSGVDIATIYGIGGIGKTTIAKKVYNLNSNNFEHGSFLANVREISEQSDGKVRLQRKLLTDLLKRKANKIYSVDEGIIKIKDVVCCKRVLVILDDVDQLDQLNAIIGMPEWFYPGSKIIITTRHQWASEVSVTFEVKELDRHESLKLFSWHAFGQGHPAQGYEKHSENVVQHCSGLPLALQVLGSSLRGKCAHVWESALQKLETILDNKILKVLKISYDSLQDHNDKSIFLDIACFFSGMDVDYVVPILNGCNYYTTVGIQNLKDRCLITINEENKLMMHQLLRDMGRNVVREESHDDPGKRSRLLHTDDVLLVLRENTGTDLIKGLKLHNKNSDDKLTVPFSRSFSKRRHLGLFSWKPAVHAAAHLFSSKAFAKMQKLKILHLSDLELNDGYEDFPKSLVWLYWRGFPLNSIPVDMCLEKLVVLDMKNSNLKHVWNGIRSLGELKILDLSHSHGLVRTPNFTRVPILEKLVLTCCVNLVGLHESVGDLKRLESLNLDNCRSLKKLPEKITMLNSLEVLNLSGCSNLVELPKDWEKMESLKVLRVDGIALGQAQQSSTKDTVELSLSSLHSTFWSWISPRRFPRSTSFLLAFLPSSLVHLSLANCNLSDTDIPKDLSCLPSLQKLDLRKNPISSLPESIKRLNMLGYLMLGWCTRLRTIPDLPTCLIHLCVQYCTSLERIGNHHQNLCEISLIDMAVQGSEKLEEVQGRFKLVALKSIDMEILHIFGLLSVESLESIELEMYFFWTRRKTKIQMVCEHGINSTYYYNCISPPQPLLRGSGWVGIKSIYLPGCLLPGWVSHQNKGSSISFEVPSTVGNNDKIIGLSLCIVYTSGSQELSPIIYGHCVDIKNKTKGVNWHHLPACFGYPEVNEEMLCLSYWMFEDDQLEGGDEVQVSIQIFDEFVVKECGIRLVHEQE